MVLVFFTPSRLRVSLFLDHATTQRRKDKLSYKVGFWGNYVTQIRGLSRRHGYFCQEWTTSKRVARSIYFTIHRFQAKPGTSVRNVTRRVCSTSVT